MIGHACVLNIRLAHYSDPHCSLIFFQAELRDKQKKEKTPKIWLWDELGAEVVFQKFRAGTETKKGWQKGWTKQKNGSDKNKTKISLQFFWGYNQAKSLSVFDKFLRSSSSYNVAVLAKLSNP